MKKIIASGLIFIYGILPLHAQIYTPSGTIQGTSGNNNVGIGATSPTEKLEVYNSDNTPGTISLKSSRNDFAYVVVGRIRAKQASTEVSRIGMPRAGGTNIGFLTFWTKADNSTDLTEKARITENGNVGIGTTNPSNNQGWDRVLDVAGADNSKILTTCANSTFKTGIFSHNSWYGGGGFIGTENDHNLHLIVGYAPKVSILTNGNVGIGTTNPTSKLSVAGNINSREVKVTVDAGADFVFESNYDLPTLAFLDNYITENKHLPEIASAKEMQANGINLSEMNIKLLQKMEEMTLYMIQQDKKINAQSKEIATFKNVLERLSKIEEKLETK